MTGWAARRQFLASVCTTPYINFRDEAWAKMAALYWPKMARIVPAGRPARDRPGVRTLIDELDWTIDIPPEEARAHVAATFKSLVSELAATSDASRWAPGFL